MNSGVKLPRAGIVVTLDIRSLVLWRRDLICSVLVSSEIVSTSMSG